MCFVKWNMDPNKIYSQSSHQPNLTSYGHQQLHPQLQQQQQATSQSGVVHSGNDIVPKGANKMTVCTGNGSGNNNGGMGGTNNSTGGNFVNVVPISMGQQHQYHHRRKLTPHEYQSRLYYNNSDYRCREDYYSTTTVSCTPSPSPSIQQQQQQQHHQQQQHQQNHSQYQPSDVVEQVLNNSRVVATQTSNNCEQAASNSTTTTASQQLPPAAQTPAPLLYTVHRVVTTAQIQTAGGNAFATSSSVSSVVSAVRNESECGGNAVVATGPCGSTTIGLHSSPGVSTNNSNYQPQQQISNSEVQQSASNISNNNIYNNSTTSSNTNYSTGAKSTTSITRPLQNVIPTCVYLMSRIAVHMEIEGTAQCPSQVMLAAALGCEELGIANKLLAQSIFGLWMTSALLEIQLKSHHRPYVVRVAWQQLLEKFSHGNPIEKKFDEPMIMLKRNVFFSKKDEEKIKDHRIIELLYEEAKHNVLAGRYVMESVHSIMLGGIQARIELGPYNSHTHTISFFRENQSRFLPQHVAKNTSWSWLPVSRKTSAEVKLLEQYKRVPQTTTTRKLMRKYLEFCWALPFYGAAFFHGQVEQPVRGIMSLVNHKDVSVVIAINERGIFIIDPVESTLLLGLRYEDLSWDFAKPSSTDDPECQTCIFIQFDSVENGITVSKLMQIFSRQAAMMDALITHFAEQMRRKKEHAESHPAENLHEEPNPIQNNGNGVLCNKLSRLTLATFDEEGRCIGQMGSLSISY